MTDGSSQFWTHIGARNVPVYAEYSDEIPNDLSPMCSFEDLYTLVRAEIYGTAEALDRELLEFTAQLQDARNFSAES